MSRFCRTRYATFAAAKRPIPTEDIKSTIVALWYRGAAESDPNNHVTRMPATFEVIKPVAMAVARRVWGALLLDAQVDSTGPVE